MVYTCCVATWRPLNTRVLWAVSLSSTREKDDGLSPTVVEKPDDVDAEGLASFTTVIDPGEMTALALSERSWLPDLPSMSMSRMWYGEPEMSTADGAPGQSSRVDMCPPHASTGFATV